MRSRPEASSSRVHLAVGRSLLFGRGAADVWKHRRPLVFIDRIETAYTVKLVTDCWTADPQTAVVYAGNSVPATNPFDAWEIPLVVDTRGFLRALLAVDKTPCLIEPRRGGFTVATCATGRVDPKGSSRRREARPLDEDPCRNRSHQRL